MAAGGFCYNSFLIAGLHRKLLELSKNMLKISPDELSRPQSRTIPCAYRGVQLDFEGRCLPDRKCSPDVMDRCAEYAEREAAANEREQYGRFHAVDRFLIDVQLISEVGHGSNLLLPP